MHRERKGPWQGFSIGICCVVLSSAAAAAHAAVSFDWQFRECSAVIGADGRLVSFAMAEPPPGHEPAADLSVSVGDAGLAASATSSLKTGIQQPESGVYEITVEGSVNLSVDLSGASGKGSVYARGQSHFQVWISVPHGSLPMQVQLVVDEKNNSDPDLINDQPWVAVPLTVIDPGGGMHFYGGLEPATVLHLTDDTADDGGLEWSGSYKYVLRLTPVPEPASLGLLLPGMAGLLRRRR